jgi:hypothetical protein
MNGKAKIGTLLVVLAFLIGTLAVATPAGADGSRVIDAFVSEVQVSDGAPDIGQNITITATVQMVEENGTDVSVMFEAVNGSNVVGLSIVDATDNVTNTTPTQIVGWWDSTVTVPDPDLVYDIKVTVSNGTAADANATNDTLILAGAVDWKAPLLGVSDVTAAAGNTLLGGDDFALEVTVKNFGDADFTGVQAVTVDVVGGSTDVGEPAEANGTTTAIAPDGTQVVTVDILALAAGDYNFTSDLNGYSDFYEVTIDPKVTEVAVTDITFTPAAGNKHTGTVTITADVENTGTLAAVDYTLTFGYGTTTIDTMDVNVTVGGTNSTSVDWVTPASMDTVEYEINVSGDDGFMTKNITLLPQPHTVLGISGIAFSPTALTAQDDVGDTEDVTVTVTVTNTGDLAAAAESVVLKADGTEVARNDTVDIPVAGQVDVTFTYTATTAEDAKEVNLTAELGAASAFKLLAIPGDIDLPDLEITAVVAAPATQERGLDADITVTVKNNGDAIAAEVLVKLFAGTTEIGTATLVNVSDAGGENTTDAITWSIPSTWELGITELNATIDGTEIFLAVNFTVEEYKKPVIELEFAKNKKGTKVKSYSAEAAEGAKKTLKVEVIVKNTGTAAAKDVFISIKDKKGKELANATVPSVAAGGEETVTIPVKMKAGQSTTLSADATYDGIHDDSYTAAATTENPKAEVVKTPGFELVVLVAAMVIAMVVLTRRRK